MPVYKDWCIVFKLRHLFRWKTHYVELREMRVDSVLKRFNSMFPDAVIEQIYVEYRKK